jgi:hypothetical protein
MYELIALTIGAGLGLTERRLGRRAWILLVSASATGTGLLVAWLSGETEESWAFTLFDIGQVVVAAVCVAALMRALARASYSRQR